VTINGNMPAVTATGSLAGLKPAKVTGRLQIPGQSIAFVAVSGAHNPACS
jgi:hypothetical protein